MTTGVYGGGFRNVDATATPAAFVNYLDQLMALEDMRRYKRESYALVGARPGARLLDLGCGAGDDARAIARLVAPGGQVIGLDSSARMIDAARERAARDSLPIEFVVGDLYQLAYPDASFDGVRADRVFQHLPDRPKALAEAIRVLRPGGTVVVSDPDWETLVLDLPDRTLIRKFAHFRCDGYYGGWTGRELPRLFRDAGLTDIAAHPFTVVIDDFALADQIYLLHGYAEKAHAAGALTAAELATWQAHLAAAASAPTFFTAFTGFTVSGRKP
ncbi:MAG: methyltransferase domain-containing protein [Thermomicrobiales bacterium]